MQVDCTDEVLSNMGDSGDSSSASDCGSPQPKGRSTNKVFVWLKEKAKCTPRGNPWVLLNREGRVKDVPIGGNYSSVKMKELVKEKILLDLRQLT